MNTATAVDTKELESLQVNPLFVRHDLMIEMARLEMEIEDVREQQPEQTDNSNIVSLKKRLEKVAHVLSRIPA
ncbi:MAG: hypothetical protein WCD36_13020 [Rhodanobacteraceae bacterium]